MIRIFSGQLLSQKEETEKDVLGGRCIILSFLGIVEYIYQDAFYFMQY